MARPGNSRPRRAPPDPRSPRSAPPGRLLAALVRLSTEGHPLGVVAQRSLAACAEAAGAAGGVLLLHDRARRRLLAAATHGVCAEVTDRLTSGAEPRLADLPLHSLENRRAYLVTDPARNPFVPALWHPQRAALVTGVAFLPFYFQNDPAGVLILVSERPRTLRAEEDLVPLSTPLILLALLLEIAPREHLPEIAHVTQSELTSRAIAEWEAAAVELPEVAAERDRLRQQLESVLAGQENQFESVQSTIRERDDLRARVAELERERQQLASDAAEARSSATRLEEAHGGARSEIERLTQERDGLASNLAAAEDARRRAEADHAALQREAEQLRTEQAQIRETLEVAGRERDTLARQCDGLRTEIEVLRSGSTATSQDWEERLRSEAAETAGLREALAASQAQTADLAAELRAARAATEAAVATADGLREDLAGSERQREALAGETHDRVRQATSSAGAREKSLRTELAALREELAARREEIARLTEKLRSEEAARASLAGEHTTLEEGRAQQAAEHDQLIRRYHDLESQLAAETSRATAASECREEIERTLAALNAEAQRLRAERDTALEREEHDEKRHADETEGLRSELHETLQHLHRLESELHDLGAERDALLREVAALRMREDTPPARASAPPPAAAPIPSAPEEPIPTATLVPVVDDSEDRIAALTAVLRESDSSDVSALINLAAADGRGWNALTDAARESPPQVIGIYVATDDDRLAVLGRVHPLVWPPDAEQITALLGGERRSARLVILAPGAGEITQVRKSLATVGASASVAWDSRQGVHLVDVVRPNAVAVVCTAERSAGLEFVARLRSGAEPREVPVFMFFPVPLARRDAARLRTAALRLPRDLAFDASAVLGRCAPPPSGGTENGS